MLSSDKTIRTLLTSLKLREMRQKVIASNIANAETPGYKAKRLDFEDALARAINLDEKTGLNTQNSEHYNVGGGGFKNLKPEIYRDPSGVPSPNGNTVNPDEEQARQTENRILHDAAVQLLNKQLGLKKYILNTER